MSENTNALSKQDLHIVAMALSSLLDMLECDVMQYPGSKSGEFKSLFAMLELQMAAADLLIRVMKSLGMSQETINKVLSEMGVAGDSAD